MNVLPYANVCCSFLAHVDHPHQAVLPRLKIYAAKARLRQIKAQLLEEQLAAQEEKLDVAAAMGWIDEEEQEVDEDEQQR